MNELMSDPEKQCFMDTKDTYIVPKKSQNNAKNLKVMIGQRYKGQTCRWPKDMFIFMLFKVRLTTSAVNLFGKTMKKETDRICVVP